MFPLNLFKSLETFSLKTATTSRYTRGRRCSNTKYREVAPSADQLLLLNPWGPNMNSALKLPSSSSYYSSSLESDSSHNRITADGGDYHSNTYFRHEKQPQLRQNVLSRRYFSLMMSFFLWCICSFQRQTEPTVTGMKNEREGASEIDLSQE